MAYAWICALSLCLVLAGISDAADYSILDFEMARRHELWMAEHGKVYRDEAEKAMRFETFKKTVKYVEDYNAQNRSNTLAVNQFADLTEKEAMNRYAGFTIPEDIEFEGHDEFPDQVNVSALPTSVDWRYYGAVSSVKQQGSCSSCWAFAAAATVESLVAIKTNVLYDLSVQQIVDCDMANSHCQPGHVYKAYEYIKSNGGLTTWANYPYTATVGVCDKRKEAATVATIGGYRWAPRNNEAALKAVVARQPVAVGIDAFGKDFLLHTTGIFRGSCGNVANHAVTLVGYGEEGGTKYWIVKNSWGTNWGESGFGKMERDVASRGGLCAIAMWPVYPIM